MSSTNSNGWVGHGRDLSLIVRGCQEGRKSTCGHALGIRLAETLMNNYFEVFWSFSLVRVFGFVSIIERFFSVEDSIKPSVCKSGDKSMFKYAFDISSSVELLPNPWIFHVLLIFLYYFRTLLNWCWWQNQLIINALTSLNSWLNRSMRAFNFQHIHKPSTTTNNNTSWES